MTQMPAQSDAWTADSMAALVARQREAFLAELPVAATTRIDRIDRAIHMLSENEGRIADAVSADYGCRPRDLSRFTEAAASISVLKHARKRVRTWMKPERRRLDFPIGLLGGRAWVEYVPKGVMGIISPSQGGTDHRDRARRRSASDAGRDFLARCCRSKATGRLTRSSPM